MRKIDRTGEIVYNKYGDKTEIVKYENAARVHVKVNDKIVITNYNTFLKGNITGKGSVRSRTGTINGKKLESIALNGQKMYLREYINKKNCTIEFEDGTIKHNVVYDAYRLGKVRNPNCDTKMLKARNKHLNETREMLNGMMAMISWWNGCMDIEVQFEDGTYKEHCTYNNFKRGSISHPSKKHKNSYLGKIELIKDINNLTQCFCHECNKPMVLTTSLMLKHMKECGNQWKEFTKADI